MSSTQAAPLHAGYRHLRKPGALPLVGDGLAALRDRLGLFEECVDTDADIVEMDFGVRTVFVPVNPDLVRELMAGDNDTLVREGNLETSAITAFLGEGVLTTDGEAWLAWKRLNAPAFSRSTVERAVTFAHESIDRSYAGWLPTGGARRRLFDDFVALATTATTTAFLSERPDEEEQQALTDALLTGPELIYDMARLRAPWLMRVPLPRTRRIARTVAAVERLIARSVARRKAEGGDAQADLLDVVLQHRHATTDQPLTPSEVRDQLFTAILAAPENIATSLSWAAFALQAHPDVLATLRRSLADGDKEYLRAVIDETLRRYAATPMIDRTAARDFEVGGVRISRGSLVVVPILTLHSHPAYWESPAAFRPERFLDGPAPRAYFPFGHGPRKCLGERLGRAVLEAALERFVVGFDWSRRRLAEPGYQALINLRPADGMGMWVERRG